MAWETGTAADHVDLLNKIRDFLTTNADLVADGQNWEQMQGPGGTLAHGDQITLRGPGLNDTDNIYFGMETVTDANNDIYNLRFWGNAGFIAEDGIREQPLRSPDEYIYCWNQPMTYWLIANGRRWMIAVKVSTVYSTAYCGFLLPYAAPSEYPYPMVVAGQGSGNARWSSEGTSYRFFADPGYGSMYAFWPDNVWRRVWNWLGDTPYAGSYSNTSYPKYGYIFPTSFYSDTTGGDFNSPTGPGVSNAIGKCFDGSYLLRDLTLVSVATFGPYHSMMGVFDGAYTVSGRENSTENIINKDGVDYLVVQNLFRNGFRDYMALRLQ